MSDVTENEFVEIGIRMADELQEFINEAVHAGCENPFPGVQEVIDDWNKIYARANTWQQELHNNNSTGNIAALENEND